MSAIAKRDAYFFIKAKMDRLLCESVTLHRSWKTVDVDAHGRAVTQVADVMFMRPSWLEADLAVRVIARRTREHTSGRQTALWDCDAGWTTQVFLTNDPRFGKPPLARLSQGMRRPDELHRRRREIGHI
jgi:hypothetical protein